jgi:transposase
MNLEKTFHEILRLDECWEVDSVGFDESSDVFQVVIVETRELWKGTQCPGCDGKEIICHDHSPARKWRHMDVFGKRSEILSSLPRGKCKTCQKVFTIKAPWEGDNIHFTKEFEAYSVALMREMPVSKAAKFIGENDTRLWRMLIAIVAAAYAKKEWSDAIWIGADEMNLKKGHKYLTVFVDLIERCVLFATEGKDSGAFERFVEEMEAHNMHPKVVTQLAIDMSAAYQKGARENLPNAKVVFDKFHVIKLVGDAVDKVRRREASTHEGGKALKGLRWLFRKNPENLHEEEEHLLSEMDLKNFPTGIAYQMRLNFQDIYKSRTKEGASEKITKWCSWVESKVRLFGKVLDPMATVAKTISKNRDGILNYWDHKLTTAFLEGLNSVFSATKRKARGYRNPEYMKTILYFIAGKLPLSTNLSH